MKNKQLKGLTNALVIDDSDSSINYIKSATANDYMYHANIDDLYDLFQDDNNQIFKVDTTNCITLISDNGRDEISLHEYTLEFKPLYIKIITDKLAENGNEIIIKLTDMPSVRNKKFRWSEHNFGVESKYQINDLQLAKKDYNGYDNSLMMKVGLFKTSPAADFAVSKYSHHDYEAFTGYIPSVGQMNILLKYLNMINYVINLLGFKQLTINKRYWWTSTEHSNYYAYCLNDGQFNTEYKTAEFNVLTIYRQLSKASKKMNTLIINENGPIKYRHGNINNESLHKTLNFNEIINAIRDYDLAAVDSSENLVLILDDNTEIAFHKYIEGKHNVRFIKLTSEYLKEFDSEIIIPVNCNDYLIKDMCWQIKNTESDLLIEFSQKEINGFENTDITYKVYREPDFFKHKRHAPIFAEAVHTNIKIDGMNYQGFVPAWKQMILIYDCREIINYVLDYLHYDTIDFKNKNWWTSSPNDNMTAICIRNGSTIHARKSIGEGKLVFPIFKKDIKIY